MTVTKDFATQVGALAVGGTAFALGDPSGGTLLATPIAALTALGLTLKSGCAEKACAKAEKQVLALLAQNPEYTSADIDRARAILVEAPPITQLDPKEVTAHIHGKDLETDLTRLIMAPLGIGADDTRVHNIIETALVASIATCKEDTEFRAALTLELVLETARSQGIGIKALERVEGKVDDMGGKLDAIIAGQYVPLADMKALAAKFGAHEVEDPKGLEQFLHLKAEDYRALLAEVADLKGLSDRVDNIHTAAMDALSKLDLDEARDLIANAKDIHRQSVLLPALEGNEKLALAEVRIALIEGDVEQAFHILSAAADSFGSAGPLEPARRRLVYEDILYRHGLRYGSRGMAFSESMIRQVLESLSKEETPDIWAAAQNSLAIALQQQGIRTDGPPGAKLLAQAVDACRAALEVHTRAEHPVQWATAQNNLGEALRNQGSRTDGRQGAQLLAQAVDAYRAAQKVYTRAEHPVHWAMTQNNLGNALAEQGSRTDGPPGAELLARAVDAYRAALEVRTRAEHPVDWAATQNNLGAALRNQGSRTDGPPGTGLLAQAVDAYRTALEVRTRADQPMQWAMTQNNLGNALQEQGKRTDGPPGAALLSQAVDAYRAALEVRTRADQPVQWAMTQENIAIALLGSAARPEAEDPQADLTAALVAVDGALEVYDPTHMSYNHAKATRLRDAILVALDGQSD